METINVQNAMDSDCVFVDVRSPAEFERERIPNAINIPVLDNEERAMIGTMYTRVNKEKAIKEGLAIFEKKVPKIISELQDVNKPIVVYCWRGGMRSKTFVELFPNKKIYQLSKGYKGYRAYVRSRLEKYEVKSEIYVVYGQTCVNKTKILQDFPNFLDLEGTAQHRGSVFGAIGLKPRSQKMFDSLILNWLDTNDGKFDKIIVEGESRKIGNVMIPDSLFKAMKKGTQVLLKAPVEKRVEVFVSEYFNNSNVPELKAITLSLKKNMGNKLNEEAIAFLDSGDLDKYAKLMFEKYYDPLYDHTFKQKEFKHEVDEEGLRKLFKKA